jgi:hypothetical protein
LLGGLKACPQCGNVNDSSATKCSQCDYNFTTGKEDTEIPRVIADEDNIIRKSPGASGGRAVSIAVTIAVLIVAGIVGFVIWGVQDDIEGAFEDPFQIDIPNGPTIEIPTVFDDGRTFTRASCTREVGNALERLLKAQSKGESVGAIFTDLTQLGAGSFEYRAVIRLYSDIDVQSELATGRRATAVGIAKQRARSECREEYGG